MDLDGDGHKDMLSGSFRPGDLYFFAGNGDRSFKAGQILKDREGKPLNVGQASAVFAADWDADGDLDLLVGNIKGELYWIANQSQTKVPVFVSPRPVAIEGEPLVVDWKAAPCVVDWDGDGHLDLLSGDGEGKVTLFRNLASHGLPRLAAGRVLVAKGKHGSPEDHPGIISKLCVTDWNQDGRLDLLLGDTNSIRGPEPEMTEAQRAELDAAQAAYEEINKKLAVISQKERQEFMQEHGIPEGQKLSEQQNQERVLRYRTLMENNEECQALLKESQARWVILKKYQAPFYRHGYVWVYLRSPAGPAIMEADAQRSEQ